MKIVITGSLGNISKPLTKILVRKAHEVTVITSKVEREKEIVELGATARTGKVEDRDFLAAAFAGADVVYCMLPASGYFHVKDFDFMQHVRDIAANYVYAINKAQVKHVVHLSSIGAHMSEGNGLLRFHHIIESALRTLPADVSITHLRPVGFYYNLNAFVQAIRATGMIMSNYAGDDLIPWVSPWDIAEVAAEEITSGFTGRKMRYIASDEVSCTKVAEVLGAAIGVPGMQWTIIPGAVVHERLIAAGFQPAIAQGLVEMQEVMHSGKLYEDYYRNRPTLSKTKITDFASDFAKVYHQ